MCVCLPVSLTQRPLTRCVIGLHSSVCCVVNTETGVVETALCRLTGEVITTLCQQGPRVDIVLLHNVGWDEAYLRAQLYFDASNGLATIYQRHI